jgi:tRNA (guanine-N7-)-methyltransferase
VAELIPQAYFAAVDVEAVFGRTAPLQVDLGCGDGDLLCELARKFPEKNFLGIEKLVGRVAKSCRKSAQLENVRVLNIESAYAIRYLLPEQSIETFYLLFPDPWPKRRHHRRRIVTADFLNSVHRALASDGRFYIVTDQLDYFQQIRKTAENHHGFAIVSAADMDLPATKFQRRFVDAGAPIYRLSLRKISPVT